MVQLASPIFEPTAFSLPTPLALRQEVSALRQRIPS
ncbi:MAG: hypothetical protein ACJASP_002157, partial [Roseivirga sp.]